LDLTVLLAADYANVTGDHKLNVMGIFNVINARAFPARHPQIHLVAKLSAGPAEYGKTRKIMVKFLNEDATQELVNWSGDIIVPTGVGGRKVEINQILQLRDLIFQSAGTYQFSILVDDDEKGTLPIFVQQQQQ